MNVDRFINSFIYRYKGKVFNKKVSLDKLIKKKFTFKKESKKMVVVMPPWNGRFFYNFFLRRNLLKKGFSVLEYDFTKEILSTDWKFTRDSFEYIRRSVVKDVDIFKKKYGFLEIKMVGVSLGCCNAPMCANSSRHIDELLLVAPGHCLAECVWKGIATQAIKREYQNKGISLENLIGYWKTIAPVNNIDKMKDKKVCIFLSKTDSIIPFYSGKKLLKELRFLGVDVSCEINRNLGHYLTTVDFYLNPEKYLSISEEKVNHNKQIVCGIENK